MCIRDRAPPVRRAPAVRRARREFNGTKLDWLSGTTQDALMFRVLDGGVPDDADDADDGLVCVLNAGARPIKLPPGEVLLASGPLIDGRLPPDTAAWLV